MNTGKNIYKAGKLLKITMDYDSAIRSIMITGDFFMYPEEKIEILQKKLVGTELTKEKLTARIAKILTDEKIETYGFNSEQLAEAIMGACKQ